MARDKFGPAILVYGKDMNSPSIAAPSEVDLRFMKMAMKLAKKGQGFVAPNPLVGALLVRNRRVVGSGYHAQFGGPHAEVNAIHDAGSKSRGATLYVTLEPCNHYGKTPPCTYAILEAGIRRVVIGMLDPNPQVSGGGKIFLQDRGIDVVSGVFEEELKRQNEFFIKHVTRGIPFVISKIAATLDGKTATVTSDSKWITSEKSRRFGHRLRHEVSAILVGVNTAIADDPVLTVRLPAMKPSNPSRFVFDAFLRIPLQSQLVKTSTDISTTIVTTESASANRAKELEARGVKVWRLPSIQGMIDPAAFLEKMGENGMNSLLIEGGSSIQGSFFDAGLVDKIYFFFAPKILGGKLSFPMIGGQGIEKMDRVFRVRQMKVRRLGEDFLVTGYV